MNHKQSKLPLGAFWYGVTFFAGLYWGISFYSGAFGGPFSLLLPPALCLVIAGMAARGDKRVFVWGAVTLCVNFLFTFAIGYGLASAGIIRFHYGSHKQLP